MSARESPGQLRTSIPFSCNASILLGSVPSPAVTRTGTSLAVTTSFDSSGNSARLDTTTRKALRGPGGRAVSSGSSAIAVPLPTMIASTRPRNR